MFKEFFIAKCVFYSKKYWYSVLKNICINKAFTAKDECYIKLSVIVYNLIKMYLFKSEVQILVIYYL